MGQRQLAKTKLEPVAKGKKKIKVTKKERQEYETIEEEVEELEIAAVMAEQELEEQSKLKRLDQSEMLELARKSSAARRAADAKMERYLELEEKVSAADA